jgi:hypothetical protein
MEFNLMKEGTFVMARTGRTEGAYAKELSYLKFYTITFKYRDVLYVYCKPEDKFTFLPLNTARAEDLEDMGICKFDSKELAHGTVSKIPVFEVAGNEVDLEVISNTFMPEMFN